MYGRRIHEMRHTNSFAFISTNADLGTFVGSPSPDESFMPGHEQLRGPWDCMRQGKIRVSPGVCQGLSVPWLTFIHLNVCNEPTLSVWQHKGVRREREATHEPQPDAVLRRRTWSRVLPASPARPGGRARETVRLLGAGNAVYCERRRCGVTVRPGALEAQRGIAARGD
jgi:hypothetical protein